MSIHIVADSTCDLSESLIARFQLTVLPLYVRLGSHEYRDGADIHSNDIFRFVAANGTLPKTAAVSVDDFADCFAKIMKSDPDAEIICITISAKFSACYQNACIAADENERITVIDSMNLSTGFGHVVLTAAELAADGISRTEIAQRLRDEIIPKIDATFIINQLDYLHKGGRCSGVAALGANLLRLKPCITVTNGEMSVLKKYRGSFLQCVRNYAADRLAEPDSIRKHRIFITHTSPPEAVEEAANAIRNAASFEDIIETQAGCTISSHCGPNTLGILFIRE
ncbi:MAG: DegV family protein [Oscillospiraceae bacterium]|nr:DegV family protein [Oscillospiraceae bacterium]